MKTITVLLPVLLSLCAVSAGAADPSADQLIAQVKSLDGWIKTSDTRDGIQVFKKSIPGSSLLAFKGFGEVAAPIVRVASILVDTQYATEWVDSLAETKVVKGKFPVDYIEYDHFNTPPIIMKDRDFLSHVKVFVDKGQKSLVFRYLPAKEPEMPVNPKYVRGELTNSVFVFSSIDGGKKTMVRAEIYADPKGSVPKWLVNFFQKDWPINTIRGMREQALKSKVQDNKAFVGLVGP